MKPWRGWVRLLGGVVLLAIVFWRLDRHQLVVILRNLDLGAWLGAAFVYLIAQVVSSWRWQLLARPLGLQGSWPRFLRYYFLGMFCNLVLPTSVGGDVLRAWYLGGDHPGHRSAAALSVLADRGSGLGILIALACGATLFCPIPLASWLTWTVASLGLLAALGIGGVLVLLLDESDRWLERIPVLGRFLGRLVVLGRVYLHHPNLLLGTAVLSVVVQGLNVVLGWLVGLGMGLSIPFAYYAIVVPLVALLTLVPISPGGVGVRELGTEVLLAPLGIASTQANALASLQFAACFVVSLLGWGFYLQESGVRSHGSEKGGTSLEVSRSLPRSVTLSSSTPDPLLLKEGRPC